MWDRHEAAGEDGRRPEAVCACRGEFASQENVDMLSMCVSLPLKPQKTQSPQMMAATMDDMQDTSMATDIKV